MKKKFWIFIFGLYALFALCSCFKSSNVSSTKDKYIEAPSWIKFDSFKVSSEKTYCNVYLNNVFIDRESCSSKSWKLRIDEALKSGDVIKLEMYILSGDYSNPKKIYNSPYSFIEITI